MSKVTNCKACDGVVSKKAKQCPHCGEKQARQYSLKSLALVIFVFIVLSSIMGGNDDDKTADVKDAKSLDSSNDSMVIKARAARAAAKAAFDALSVEEKEAKAKEYLSLAKKISASNHSANINAYRNVKKYTSDKSLIKFSDEKIAYYTEKKSQADKQAKLIADKKARKAKLIADKKARQEKCFSGWDGSHTNLERYVKANLKDPDSYEHIETKFYKPNSGNDRFWVKMKYRARNGFGGMTIGETSGLSTLDCKLIEIS